MDRGAGVVIRDRSQWAELAVLATVLAIAALASYIHLREVWLHAGAPVASIGPLTVDGLFAAAWLRMRRRRHQGELVGFLAWLALGLALVATVAGNLAAAVIAGHRDLLSLVVAAWPAVAFAVVWELVTGHGRQDASQVGGGLVAATKPATELESEPDAPTEVAEVNDLAGVLPGAGERLASIEQRVAHLVHVEGYGRPRIAKALGVRDTEARRLLDAHKDNCQKCQEATG